MTDLQRSHAELRAAVMLAGKEIRKLNFGRADSLVLALLRRVLRDARAVARKEGNTTRGRLELKSPISPAGKLPIWRDNARGLRARRLARISNGCGEQSGFVAVRSLPALRRRQY